MVYGLLLDVYRIVNMYNTLVILATYNGGFWLKPQVDSILAQQCGNLHLLIGDDCSTDSAVDNLEDASLDNGSGLQVVRFSAPSGGAGQNFIRIIGCANLSVFDYIAFSDQDDVWYSDKLERAIASLERTGANGYSSAVTAFWPDGREKVLSQNPNLTDLDFLFEGAGQGCTFVLRGDFAQRVQTFIREGAVNLSGIHYHDWLIYAASRALGKKWIFDPEPSMHYRQHDGNDTGARSALLGVQKRIGMIRNGWYVNQVRQMLIVISALNPCIIPDDFLAVWNRKVGFQRRILLASILFKRGRRRLSDRVMLTVAALMGWL